jgi:hypothetical protein
MKNPAKKIITLAFAGGLAAGCAAQNLTFLWSPPPAAAPGEIAGYRLWRAPAGTTNWSVAATATTNAAALPLAALAFGDRFCVTATNQAGLESLPSNIVTNLVPRAPESLRAIHILRIPD